MKSKVRQKTQNKNNAPMVTAPPVAEIRDILENSKRVLVASHVDPDGDAIGTQLAFAFYLRKLGKEVFLVREADVPTKYRFLGGTEDITPVDEYPEDFRVDTAVILECPSKARIGKVAKFLHDDVKIVNIDHHYESGEFGTVNWIDPTRSSVGEMTYDLFEALDYNIPPEVAEQLYTAIMTDTGRFRYQSTSPRTMEVVGHLIGAGADPKKITEFVYFRLSASTMKLTGQVLSTIDFHDDDSVCLLTITKKMLQEAGADMSESDGLVDFTLFADTVDIGALLKEVSENETRVSLRSRDHINVSEIAARYGGGGHFNASGCSLDMNLDQARQELIKVLTDARRGKKS